MNTRDLAEASAAPDRVREQAARHSLWTLASLGFLAYYVTVMWHEIVGHGSVMYLIGARHFILTSTSMSSPDVQLTGAEITTAARVVLLAGAFSNIALGLVIYPIFRFLTRTEANLTLRLFLWLLAALNFFLGFIYPLFSGVFDVADFSMAIVSLPHQALLRVLEVVVGALLCVATVRFFARSFAEFPESLWRLCLVPYVSASLLFCLAGLRNPDGDSLIISVLPAALLGQCILLFVTPLARKLRVAPPPPQALPLSPVAISVALVFVVVIFLTAPGVRFTMP